MSRILLMILYDVIDCLEIVVPIVLLGESKYDISEFANCLYMT